MNPLRPSTAQEIRQLDEIITRLERSVSIRPGTVEIGASIEAAVGVANGYEIASASPRVQDFGGASGYDIARPGRGDVRWLHQFVYGKGELELVARTLGIGAGRALSSQYHWRAWW